MSIVNSSPLVRTPPVVNASTQGNSTLSPVATPTVTRARVVGTHGHWTVFLGDEKEEWPLVLTGNLREFRHFESVINQLKNYQIESFTVELAPCKSADKEVLISPNRPRVLKRAGSAQAYDTWFREQVMQSLSDNAAPLGSTHVTAQMNIFKQTKLPAGGNP